MSITALALVCCNALAFDGPVVPPPAPTAMAKNTEVAPVAANTRAALPESPSPKINRAVESTDASEPPASSFLNSPVKPVDHSSFETPRKRRIWYGLMVVGHATAGFDSWTTRQAVSGHYGTEANPLERPFAHSGAIYASTQVTPLLMDFLGRRLMRSSHPLLRRMWWLPQAAGASVSLGAAAHNYSVVH